MTGGSERVSKFGHLYKLLILIVFGFFSALGQAPLGVWPATLFALAGAMMVMEGPASRRRAFVMGWALGFGYFAAALHWIVEPFLVDVARHGWMAPFALLFMAAGGGVFWGLAVTVAQFLGRGCLSPFAIALGLLAAEITRSLIFTGFPWALIGHVWIDTPMAQLSAYLGPHGLTALTMLIAAVVAGRKAGAIALVTAPVALFWVWQGWKRRRLRQRMPQLSGSSSPMPRST